MCVDSGKWRIIVIDRLYIYLTGRGWGMWRGSWMNVNGECVCSWMGVYGELVCSWM